MGVDLKRINGNAISYGSGTVKIAGARISGIQELDYGDKRVRELVYGMDRAQAPIAVTRGEYQPDEGRMAMLASSAEAVRVALANASGSTSYGDATFTVDVTWRETGLPVINVQLLECTIISDKDAPKRGPGPVLTEFGLQYKFIKRNGRTLYSAEPDGT